MKKQTAFVKAHLVRGAFYLLFLLTLCAIPFALGQRKGGTRVGRQMARPKAGPVAPAGGVYAAWVATYNGPGNNIDEAHAIAVDDSGNVYVTGRSTGNGIGFDYATIKYNSVGQQQWLARYTGFQGYGDDEANAIAVDSAGNVYVTGRSTGIGTAEDYATIKYNSAGQQQWVARYNGPGNFTDVAYAIAVDKSGNVYVTGQSDSSGQGGNYDYVTIKYNSDGQQQWLARYNGPGNDGDAAYALALDASGNVYVTGVSVGSGTGADYATIKYDSSGQQQWVARYNGPVNGDEYAYAVAVDNSGNVYVTGTSRGTGVNFDYATVKYDSTGQQQWVARYTGPGGGGAAYAIAVDKSGSVYVTGASNGDYATIKYDSAGQQQWVALYNGPANSDDEAHALALDGLGNVYVTGQSYGAGGDTDCATVKYDSAGQEQWVIRYNGPGNPYDYAFAMAVDSSANVYVAGETNTDYLTIKYVQGPTPTPTASPTPTATASPTPTPTAPISRPCTRQGWSAGPDMPSAGVRMAGVYFPINGNFYAMGGRSMDGVGTDFTHPFEYDAFNDRWNIKLANFPDNQVGNMACGVLIDAGTPYIYCVGGSAGGQTTATGRVFRYDPIADTIAIIPALWPGDSDGITLPGGFTVFNNKLYILGGFRINTAVTNQIWEFTPGTNTWAQKNAVLPLPRGYIPTVTYFNYIYTAGGSDWNGTDLIDTNDSFRYDPVADSIITVTSIPRATGETRALKFAGGVGRCAPAIWLMGGGRTPPNPSNEVDIDCPDVWATGPPFVTARRDFPTDTDGGFPYYRAGHIWLAGGYGSDGVTPLSSMEIYCYVVPTPSEPPGTPTSTPTATARLTATFTPTVTATSTATPTCCQYTTAVSTGAIVPGTTDTGNHCDDCTTLVPLPFTVLLYGQIPTGVASVSSNGNLQFVNRLPYAGTSCPLPDVNLATAILPYQDHLRTDQVADCSVFASGCGVFTSMTGTAPNRAFNIEWRAAYSGRAGTANFEVRFYENQSFFDIFYGATADDGASEESGVQAGGSLGCPATTFSCHTPTLTNGLRVTYTCGAVFTPTPTPTPTSTATITPPLTPTPTVRPTPTPRLQPTPRTRPTPPPRP